MATGIWMAIFAMVFWFLVHLFKRFIQGKSEEQIRVEELKKEEIDMMTSTSFFKSKAKKEKELDEIRSEIVELEKKINSTNSNDNKSSNISIAKAVVNHAKDTISEIKPTIKKYKEKHQTSQKQFVSSSSATTHKSSDEDKIYEQVMIEIEKDNKVKGTWAKALAQCDGNKDKAQSLYIQLRVEKIKNEQTN